jgi:hypothetical protein
VKIMIFGVSFIFCVTLGELTSQCLNSCFCKMWIVAIFNLILEIFKLFLKYLEKFQTIVNSRYRKKKNLFLVITAVTSLMSVGKRCCVT